MIYGYDSKTVNEHGLKEMKEVSLCVSAQVLRELANFLFDAADELENAKSKEWHRHIPAELQKMIECDVVVCVPD